MADFGDRHNGPMCNSMHIMSNGDLLSRKPPVAQIPCLARVLAARPRVLRPDDSFRWPKGISEKVTIVTYSICSASFTIDPIEVSEL